MTGISGGHLGIIHTYTHTQTHTHTHIYIYIYIYKAAAQLL